MTQLLEYCLFLAQTLTILGALLVLIFAMAAASGKNRRTGGELKVRHLNRVLRRRALAMRQAVLSRGALKQWTKAQAKAAADMLWKDHAKAVRANRAAEMEARVLKHGDQSMPFHYEVFGEKPAAVT